MTEGSRRGEAGLARVNMPPVFRCQAAQVQHLDRDIGCGGKHVARNLEKTIRLRHFTWTRMLAARRAIDQQNGWLAALVVPTLAPGENPTTYLRHNLRVALSASDYVRITRSFFAISTERRGVILYSRCNFSGGVRGVIHCFDLKYPQQEKRSWDAVVTRISLSLRPLES